MQDRRFHKTSYKQITSQVEWDVYIPEKSRSVNFKLQILQILSAQKSKSLDGFEGLLCTLHERVMQGVGEAGRGFVWILQKT